MRFLIWSWLALFSMPAASSASTAAARAELDRRGIAYTEKAFVDSAAAGNLAVVKLFVDAGMSVNTANRAGSTVLHSAAEGGHLDVVRYLVGQGADVNATNNAGQTPLLEAAWGGHLDVVRYLVGRGADVNAKDFNGNTGLHAAARSGELEVVEYLVEEQGLDVNATNNDGGTVLSYAAWGGSLAVVQYLVEEQGADVKAKYDNGRTALHGAASSGHLSVVRFLVEQGADVNATNKHGSTVLHGATGWGHLSVVQYLVENGASLTARDNSGRTPRGRAAGGGKTDVAAYLASVGEREKLISIPSSGVGKWEVDQELDPVNDKQNVIAALPSEDFVRGRSGALLGMTCEGGEVFEKLSENPPWGVLNKPSRRSLSFPRKRESSRYRLDARDNHQSFQTASEVQILPQGVKVAYESDASSDVIWRFDKLKAVSKKWVVSKDRETLYPMSKYSRKLAEVRVQQIRWAQKLLVHSQLFVRIKDSEGKRGAGDFVFDLRGSAKAVDLVLGACGW